MTETNTSSATAPLSSRQNIQALVSAAVSSHRTGNTPLAEQFLQQALQQMPDHPDAQQLMGMIAKEKGDLKEAEAWMAASLRGEPRQPHVHYNLANLLLARGAVPEALEHYEQAVRQKADHVDALIGQGEALMLLGRLQEAETAFKSAFRLKPDMVLAVVSLADLYGNTGRADEAETLLRAALRTQPDNPYYLNNLGQLLTTRMRYEEAVGLLQTLPAKLPDNPHVFVNLANAVLGLGRIDDAIQCYSRAIQLDPLNYFAHQNLNDILYQNGRMEEVGRSFEFAKRVLGDHPDALEMSAECMINIGKLAEAEADLRAAEKQRPNTPGQFRLWTALRLAQGNAQAAVQLAAAGLQQDPSSLDLRAKLTEGLLRQDVPEQALTIARSMEEIDRNDQAAISFQVNALRLMGDEEAAKRLYDYDNFVKVQTLPVPERFPSKEAYLQHLTEKLDLMHLSKHEPVRQTLRNGTQTQENLFDRPGIDPAIAELGRTAMEAARAYMAALPDDLTHPYLRRKAGNMAWSGSWSVRLRGGGHHTDHIHPKGWISGVIYITVPDCVADEEGKPGWIKFGEFARAEGQGRSLPWQKAVRPEPLKMVLFPSYMTHGTIPTIGDQIRMTVDFDIIPA